MGRHIGQEKDGGEKSKPRLLIKLKMKVSVDLIMKNRKLLQHNSSSLRPMFIMRGVVT